MQHLDPPRPCEVFMGGDWWPGDVRAWERRPDGWWGWRHVHVWEVRVVPRVGVRRVPVTYVQWVPAGRLRARGGGVVDVEAWARNPPEPLAPSENGS